MSRLRESRIGVLGAAVLCAAATVSTVTAADPPAPRSFRVTVVGQGQPMVLIPGLSSSGDTWNTTVARYRDRFACHVLTLAGFAGVPPIEQPLLASVRAELAEYIRTQHLTRPVVVGHSLGGTLALALAADHPDLVGPIVVVDSLPFLAGAQMQAKTPEDAKPAIAAMRAYMANQSRSQYGDRAVWRRDEFHGHQPHRSRHHQAMGPGLRPADGGRCHG